MTDLRYPIGPLKGHTQDHTTAEERLALMDEIEATPARLRAAVAGLDDTQLDTPYRQDGWTGGRWFTTWSTATSTPTCVSAGRSRRTDP